MGGERKCNQYPPTSSFVSFLCFSFTITYTFLKFFFYILRSWSFQMIRVSFPVGLDPMGFLSHLTTFSCPTQFNTHGAHTATLLFNYETSPILILILIPITIHADSDFDCDCQESCIHTSLNVKPLMKNKHSFQLLPRLSSRGSPSYKKTAGNFSTGIFDYFYQNG